MARSPRIFVAGHSGLIGSALCHRLTQEGAADVLTVDRTALDLRRSDDVRAWIADTRPTAIVMAAGTVGGLPANIARPADFIADNLAMHTAIIDAAREANVTRLLLLGCACMYPHTATQPMAETALWMGPPDAGSLPYATAKLAAVTMAQAYAAQHGLPISIAIPATVYGPRDNFSVADGHVVGALMQRMHAARVRGEATITLSGSGRAQRDFIFVEDVIDACLTLLSGAPSPQPVNIGRGQAVSVAELAEIIRDHLHPGAAIRFSGSGPDGVPVRVLDTTRMTTMGWRSRTSLREGVQRTCEWLEAALAAGTQPRGWAPA